MIIMHAPNKKTLRHQLVTERNINKQLRHDLEQVKEQLYSLFERVSGCEVSEFDSEQVNYLADMIEGQMDADNGAVENLKCDLKQFEWISVEDRLPDNERVIAFTDNEDETMRYRFIPKGLFKQIASEATHWMNLPQPPKEK